MDTVQREKNEGGSEREDDSDEHHMTPAHIPTTPGLDAHTYTHTADGGKEQCRANV